MTILPNNNQPLVCDMTAIPAADREDHILEATQIFQSAQTIRELPNGYALQLPNEGDMWMALARFVESERKCCPFFHFVIEAEPNAGPFHLQLTGGEGVKELLQASLSDQLGPEIRKQLIQTGGDTHLDEVIEQNMPRVGEALKKAAPVE